METNKRRKITVDGNEACASVAHRLNEVIAIYPITPSSAMGELSDEWSVKGRTNVFGVVPDVIEMQSEAGAIGAVHGSLLTGSLATTFTSSQGLLLMIPDMYKIAGELTPFAMHVAARAVATHALSIFGDHSDVMACRQTGFAMLAAGSVQEAHDFACIAQAATLVARVPFLHFFDGFRTSHEITRIEELSDDDLRAMIDEAALFRHRARALSPDHPVMRGTAQNPDTFFQAREACNPFYAAVPRLVLETMERFDSLTGRRYRLFEYSGHPRAERVVVVMGSGGVTAAETAEFLAKDGERVGVLRVRLYRPFDVDRFLAVLPETTRKIAVLDRTKEPGSVGEPLYLDVVAALAERQGGAAGPAEAPLVVGGRYGLSSKEFTPAMVKAVFDELKRPSPKRRFTVGIEDDVTGSSLRVDRTFDIETGDVHRSVFFGLGSDGTVGANKNSIKIIGEETENEVQGYFVYDSKKSGTLTTSHLRFGPRPIRAPWLVTNAGFVGCHQYSFVDRYDILGCAAPGASLLLNAPFAADEVWKRLPAALRHGIVDKHIRLYVIDAAKVARENGLGGRINTIMQACFFAIARVLPVDRAIAAVKEAVEKTYKKRGAAVVQQNLSAIDAALGVLQEVGVVEDAPATGAWPLPGRAQGRPRSLTEALLAHEGDLLPVSAFPVDGAWPVGTSHLEKRNLADEIPVWDADLCIQCNKCVLFCPHAAIRAKVYSPAPLCVAPPTFKSVKYRGPEYPGLSYTIQVAPEDCTGCRVCVEVCPAHDKQDPARRALAMTPQEPLRLPERENFDFFLELPELQRQDVARLDAKGSQFIQPLFEFSGACAGCGETPYVKLLTELFGDRLLIANATGCSSIYGGNLPTSPYTVDRDGCGPAWANSLFEDNAEFGLGFRLGVDVQARAARALVRELQPTIGAGLAASLLSDAGPDEASIAERRKSVEVLRSRLAFCDSPEARRLEAVCEHLVPRSVWLVGGDGWAYDIGFGGLDHVLASGRKVNVLVLDTEVYSNTGGQQSKATPIAAAARFATAGKASAKKDLGLMAMTHGNVYVASVALGAKDSQTVRALREAESYPGPSLVIAYSPCIAHGYDLAAGPEHQKMMVRSGSWLLYRFDPRRAKAGEPALQLDSQPPSADVLELMRTESRFGAVDAADHERFERLARLAGRRAAERYALYRHLAQLQPLGAER